MAASTAQPDMSLIGELYEIIDREPPAIEARKILIQQFLSVGWMDAARDAWADLNRLCPHDDQVKEWQSLLQPMKPAKSASKTSVAKGKAAQMPKTTYARGQQIQPATLPTDPTQLEKLRKDMFKGFEELRIKAGSLLKFTGIVSNTKSEGQVSLASTKHIDTLQLIAEGKVATALRRQPVAESGQEAASGLQPQSAGAIVKSIKDDEPAEALRKLLLDFENIIKWSRSKPSEPDNDQIRATLVKRSQVLKAGLPQNLQTMPSIALMHMEHEYFERNYTNDETMLGDAISDIHRDAFFASEDNYAWDMDELAQAISANGGIMRNPLSREMFSQHDIKFIVKHPKGSHLAAMAVEQSKLSKGVRLQTIDQMQKMAKVLLDDQSADQLATRKAVDEFHAYLATLPEEEQTALDKLRVPAKDSHTGQAYDATIGDSLRDALGNRQCFHKTGDFIQQAANHLRKRF